MRDQADGSTTTESRREELLRIAADLFASKGFRNTTVRDIADAAGILSGSLYHHFDSKESMVDELMRTFQAELFAAYDEILASSDDARSKLERAVRLSFETIERRGAEVAIFQNEAATLGQLERFGYLAPEQVGETLLHRNLAKVRAWYDFAVRDLAPSPTAERALAWLEANVPMAEEQGDPVLCWGDARIGNVIYRDFEPVAVLDWEMVTLGPRALDVSWLLFAHQVFESIVGMLELPGMPHFLREEDVVATYAEKSGVELGDLDWYHVYNGLQWCIVFMRTGARQVHFGEIEMPADIESLFHCKPLLESILAKVGA